MAHFERIFQINRWDLENDGVARLLPLLNAKLRDIFVSLPQEYSLEYSMLKSELLAAVHMNSEFYRSRFRQERIRPGQTFRQHGYILQRNLQCWLDACKIPQVYESLLDFFLRDQLLAAVAPEIRAFIKDKRCATFKECLEEADVYAGSHNLYPKDVKKAPQSPTKTKFMVLRPLSKLVPRFTKVLSLLKPRKLHRSEHRDPSSIRGGCTN